MAKIPPRVSVVTLGVENVTRATAFYEALGWEVSSASVAGEVTFLKTQGGILALYGDGDLARDSGHDPVPPAPFRGVTLSCNVESTAEVDEVIANAEGAGARILKPPSETLWGGYNATFADRDGHVWEVVFNPAWPMGPDGRPVLP